MSCVFFCYRNTVGKNLIDSHLRQLSKRASFNLRRTLEHLRVKPFHFWDRPHASPLGNHIYVIRFKDEQRTQHRFFGHHQAGQTVFVITLYGQEKDNHYEPSNYRRTCEHRQRECLADPRRHTCACLECDDPLFPAPQTLPHACAGLDGRRRLA